MTLLAALQISRLLGIRTSRDETVCFVRCVSGLKSRTVYWKSMICALLPNSFLCVSYKLLESVPSEGRRCNLIHRFNEKQTSDRKEGWEVRKEHAKNRNGSVDEDSKRYGNPLNFNGTLLLKCIHILYVRIASLLCNFTCEAPGTSFLLPSLELALPVVVDGLLGVLELTVINLWFWWVVIRWRMALPKLNGWNNGCYESYYECRFGPHGTCLMPGTFLFVSVAALLVRVFLTPHTQ